MTDINIEIIQSKPADLGVKTPLLLIHGAYAGAWCWQPNFLPFFAAQGYEVFALSLRGHGASGGRAGLSAASIANYVDDVATAVARIEADIGKTPILIGHSMGGFVAMSYARDNRVPAIALLAAVPPEGLMGSALHLIWQHPQLMWELNLLQNGGMPPKLDKLRELLFSPDLDNQRLSEYAARFQHESDRALIDMSMPQFDQRPPLGQPPALVLGSTADKLMPAHLIYSSARCLGVRAQMLNDIGHLFMLDSHWRLAADAVAAWVVTLP